MLTGILAAAGLAARELGGDPVFRTLLTFHTRSHSSWQGSLGWYVGLAPIELHHGEADGFGALMPAAKAAARSGQSISRIPFGRILELLKIFHRPRFVISYMDTRFVPGSGHWKRWGAQIFGKVPHGPEVYLWFNRTTDGIYVTARFPDTAVAQRNTARYIARVRGVLAAVAETGDYTADAAFAGRLSVRCG